MPELGGIDQSGAARWPMVGDAPPLLPMCTARAQGGSERNSIPGGDN